MNNVLTIATVGVTTIVFLGAWAARRHKTGQKRDQQELRKKWKIDLATPILLHHRREKILLVSPPPEMTFREVLEDLRKMKLSFCGDARLEELRDYYSDKKLFHDVLGGTQITRLLMGRKEVDIKIMGISKEHPGEISTIHFKRSENKLLALIADK